MKMSVGVLMTWYLIREGICQSTHSVKDVSDIQLKPKLCKESNKSILSNIYRPIFSYWNDSIFRKLFPLLSLCDAILAKTSRKFVFPTRSISLFTFRGLSLVQMIAMKLFTVLPHRQLGAVRKEFKRTLLAPQKYTLFNLNVQKP